MEGIKTSAVIVAAGRSTRMGTNKMLVELGSMSVFERTVRAFEEAESVDEVVVVSSAENLEFFSKIVHEKLISKVTAIVLGGENRGESVRNGLHACRKDSEVILIHDGARPLIKSATINDVVAETLKHGVAAVGVKSTDTVKILDSEGFAVDTMARETLIRIQTPQGFKRHIIFEAHEKALSEGFEGTDDCSLTERMGLRAKVIRPPYVNIKLTSPEDLVLATAVLRERGKL